MAQHAGVARHSYNWGLALTKQILDHNRANPEEKIKFPSAIDLHKWLVALVKSEHPWYYSVSKCAPQYALRALADAWKRCFNKLGGAPRFKKKGRNDRFTLDGAITCDHFKIKLPRIGWVKTYERLPHGFKPKSVTASRQADRWFISFKVEVEPQETPKQHDVVGVDLGVKNLAILSPGEVFVGAKSYRKYEARLAHMQWLNRRRQIGSSNDQKVQLKIAKLHRKVANLRKDSLHKLTTYLAKNHGRVVVEDLNVSGMMANRKLAKAIQDMGFFEFRRQLKYKCELYGSELVIVNRWFPSSKTCSSCGTVKEQLSLSEQTFGCSCGLVIDRDLNAALNLAKAGSSPVTACGVVSADAATAKQEQNR